MASSAHSYVDPEKPAPYAGSTEKDARSKDFSHDPELLAGELQDFEELEVFRKDGEVDFRTVSWPRATVIFLKIIFATGVLSIPTAMVSLGAVGGALIVIAWGVMNTYTAVIQGDFRNKHAGCHSIADMAMQVGGVWVREIVGFLFVIAYVLCTGMHRRRPSAAS